MRYSGPCIDADVHHDWASEAELHQYLSKEWREFVRMPGKTTNRIRPATMAYPHTGGTNKRIDTYPPNGGGPGSDYATMKRQLLDPLDVRAAILSYSIGHNAGLPNLYLATAVCRAANDWSIDRWLDGRDDRLFGAVLVPTQVPEEAAAEVRRVGRHPRMKEVILISNGLGKPFGHPAYHPIYEAAVDVGLPVALHVAGELSATGAHVAGGGVPSTRLENITLAPQAEQHHLTSLIAHGVFEKYRALKILLVENGVSWLPWLLWNLDDNYKYWRQESPWVKKRPSEYVRERVKLTTQPLEDPARPEQLMEVLESFGGMEDLLCFATDYPHWDADDPQYIARKLPESWLPKVFYENAREFFGLPKAAPAQADGGAARG
ncbi:MAG TPA: amidohydrolase family protein [bacterium]|nr:amidohydrolase family protein [bacterium]